MIQGHIGRDLSITMIKTMLLLASIVSAEAFIQVPTKKSGVALGVFPESHEIHKLDPSLAFDDEYDNDDDLFLFDETEEETSDSIGVSLARGELVVEIPEVATSEECNDLFRAALHARSQSTDPQRGRSRFSVSDPQNFDPSVVFTCDEILLRVIDYIDEELPEIYESLFQPNTQWLSNQPLNPQGEELTVPPSDFLSETCNSLRDLYMMGELEWSEGEPAINVYEETGYFGAHKDHLALTILIPLTDPAAFTGGGTGYWANNRGTSENPDRDPDLVLKPKAGSALLFGGDVTHAGLAIQAGCRSVLVCSMSTRTPASRENRLHGLQAPPVVSANFKGTI